MARMPDFPKFSGRTTRRLVSITEKKTTALLMRIASRNFQFTVSHFSSDSERKMSDGSAKVPT